MLKFCLQSLFREYGWRFFNRIAMPHPLRTAKALLRSGSLDISKDIIAVSTEETLPSFGGRRSIVGVGFCLKPIDPPCLSGRSNHDCYYLEHLLHSKNFATPDCCKRCAIREMGIETLRAGAAFYIMTSAKDILEDIFMPGLREGRFSSGLFVLCRYSIQPFAVGLLASGIHGWLFPFERGDCADYKTWLLADRGVKDDQTQVDQSNRNRIREMLTNAAKGRRSSTKFETRGNIFYPAYCKNVNRLFSSRQ